MNQEETLNKTKKERLSEIFDALSPDQIRYLTARLEYSKKNAAAEYVDIPVSRIYNWKENKIIDEAVGIIKSDAIGAAIAAFENRLFKAVAVKIAGLESGTETVRQSAATEVIDRMIGKAAQTTTHRGDPAHPIQHEVTLKDWQAKQAATAAQAAETEEAFDDGK